MFSEKAPKAIAFGAFFLDQLDGTGGEAAAG
ncbi:hypothetical protein SGRA_0892 [Saprospira grandis str. Lewin]|uniref:Uncharacterized protein n=2 Tax=Saprospira grandis TaxID=1008 RepID=H6L2H0_SAPGL|nr:hypothetical protein SGRA_0892 [Saprospira grandis str. Lewin]